MKRLLLVLIPLIAIGFATGSRAACSLPASTASFGTVTSFTAGSAVSATSTTARVNCGSGLIIGLLSSNNITLALSTASNISATRGTMKRAGDTGSDNIPVQLCAVSTCASEMTIGATAVTYSSSQLLNLGLGGSYNFSIPLYLRTVLPATPVAAGTYSVMLSVAVTYRICTGLSVGGLLCLSGQDQNGSGVIPLTVTMVVTNDCTTINAPNISFGSAPLVGSFTTVSQSISVICTKGSSYSVGLSNGAHAVNNLRYMASGSNMLGYEIYKASSSDRWGANGSERQSSANANTVSSDGVTRSYNYTARVLTTQNTPAVGSYTDNVVVDLSF
ncbi:spore coat protein U domain-containing protein [Pantoea sp. B65]|uniref:Csu type fimbrial protein n=1 Tax=Pantoea sp. B65 TaxID=2813359 RepID=UPI0039B52A71